MYLKISNESYKKRQFFSQYVTLGLIFSKPKLGIYGSSSVSSNTLVALMSLSHDSSWRYSNFQASCYTNVDLLPCWPI